MAQTQSATRETGKKKKVGNGGMPPEAEHAEEEIAETPEASKVHFESFLSRDEAVAYFEAIVAGLRKGTVSFRQKDEHLTLHAPSHVDVEVKASRKSGRERIAFELGWRVQQPSELTIVAD